MLPLAGLCLLIGSVYSTCPHEDGGLALFSDIFPSFDENSVLVIQEPVLLDLAEVEVSKIEITGTNGKLVFGRGIDISVTANGIFVKQDGQLIIGSESCRHEDKVNIYLKGDRTEDRSSLGQDGDKYIAVQDNGVLEIHGQDKLAWTKLDSTVERFDKDRSRIKYQHQTSSYVNYRRWDEGLALYIFCHALEEKFYHVYDMWKNNPSGETEVVNSLIEKLGEIKINETVVLNIHNYLRVSDSVDLNPLWETIEDLAGMTRGELLLRQAQKDDASSVVFTRGVGYDQGLDQKIGKYITEARASVTHNGMVISGRSKVESGAYHRSLVDVRLLEESVANPEITVLDDVSSWQAGDEILLTSTDYEFDHGEVRKIKTVSGNRIVLDHELEYRHYGAIEEGVDMRGEVALLTRNIKIQGIVGRDCPDRNGNCDRFKFDTYGGHIKIIEGFGSVFIEGAEMKHVGQNTDIGFYPIHFHMCLNITGKTAIVKQNSIHDTFQRAVVVHGTFGASEDSPGVQVIENVAYNVMGHCYFLEDGAEAGTKFERNLGALIRNVHNNFFKTDKSHATVFWITNPKTVMIGNVAAGSEGLGIWYTFPEEPLAGSRGLVYVKDEMSRTPLWTFDNNIVHSNRRAGMNFDNILEEGGSTAGCMRYSPVVDPLDKKSDRVLVSLSRLTAYKNPSINTWIRGGGFLLMQYSSAESKRGLQLASGGNQEQFVRKSTFIGRSSGNNEDDGYPDGMEGADLNHYLGIVFYDGPIYVQDSYFNGFVSDVNNTWAAGALGFQPKNKFSSSVVSQVSNLRFGFNDGVNGNRVFDGNFEDELLGFGNFDGDEVATFRDIDGSVTRCDGHTPPTHSVQVVKPEKMLLTSNCVYRENWKMAKCNDHYGKLSVRLNEAFDTKNMNDAGVIRRRRYDDVLDVAYEDSKAEHTHEYMTILGSNTYYYEYQFVHGNAKKFGVTGKGIEKDNHVVVGVCLPEGTTVDDLELYIRHPNNHYYRTDSVTFVNSLEDIKSDTTMSRLFLDGRMLYVKMLSKRTRDPGWDSFDTDQCPGDWCPYFEVKVTKRSVPAFTPCFSTTAQDLTTDVHLEGITNDTCTMAAQGLEPDWGAGDTRAPHDGQWGEWAGWTDCCNTPESQATRTRYRLCNNPTPFGGGQDCPGNAEETDACQKDCPVNGSQTTWSRWSECFCDGVAQGSAGVKKRTRACTAANGGKYCYGSLEEYYPCNGECEEN